MFDSLFDSLLLLFARSSELHDWLSEDDDGSNFSWLSENFLLQSPDLKKFEIFISRFYFLTCRSSKTYPFLYTCMLYLES